MHRSCPSICPFALRAHCGSRKSTRSFALRDLCSLTLKDPARLDRSTGFHISSRILRNIVVKSYHLGNPTQRFTRLRRGSIVWGIRRLRWAFNPLCLTLTLKKKGDELPLGGKQIRTAAGGSVGSRTVIEEADESQLSISLSAARMASFSPVSEFPLIWCASTRS